MTITAIVTGQVVTKPEQKTSKNGKPFTVFNLKSESHSIKVLMFDEFMDVREWDVVAVSGQLEAKVWQPEHGEPKVSLTIVARQGFKMEAQPKSVKYQV